MLLPVPLVTSASRQVAFAATQQTSQAAKPLEQMVPMRDGVKLATSIYLPQGNGPWPAVLVRTPYGKELQATGNSVWTNREYALIVQDTRGRFKSEGEYRPFMTDHSDGYDTIEWIAKQTWSNGKI
jgi:putative CocE/NonD family hydrolase